MKKNTFFAYLIYFYIKKPFLLLLLRRLFLFDFEVAFIAHNPNEKTIFTLLFFFLQMRTPCVIFRCYLYLFFF